MKNRRNYYRLLRVQPDASLEIIKHSYRTLMQKLQHHPDLGGEEWNARNINMAYATLRDPKKRATYDRKLFAQHDIETLSRGNLGKTPEAFKTKSNKSANQRNYYRILQVQSDAELAVIEASYKLLKREPDANKALLDEVWKTLHNDVKRRQYDQQLKGAKIANNANNAEHPKNQQPKQKPEQHRKPPKSGDSKVNARQKKYTASPDTKTEQTRHTQTNDQSTPNTSTSDAGKHVQHQDREHAYSAQSGQYCLFCHTPYSHNDYAHRHEYCDECCSPLLLLSAGFSKLPRRHVARAKAQKPAVIYSSWPGKPSRIALSDLSPTGLSFINKRPLIVGNLIKIDAEEFKAIAELRYCKAIGALSKIGVHFLTIQFAQQRGALLSTSA